MGRSTGQRENGVIAQEVESVFPELVTSWGDEGYKAVDYGRLTGVLIEAIKAPNPLTASRLAAECAPEGVWRGAVGEGRPGLIAR